MVWQDSLCPVGREVDQILSCGVILLFEHINSLLLFRYEAVTLPDNQGTEEVEEIERARHFSESDTMMGFQQASYVSMVGQKVFFFQIFEVYYKNIWRIFQAINPFI